VKIPGVGKKTAERLLIEMRDRLKDWQVTQTSSPLASGTLPIELHHENAFATNAKGDAINALVSLGYSQQQADKAIRTIFKAESTSENLIRDALKSML
jgi:Holliday junction DNA helicase RuvA